MKRPFELALALVVGCAAPAARAPVAPLDADPDAPGAVPANIDLDRADAFEVLEVAQRLVVEPVLVETPALAPLRCITVTVKGPNPLPPREAANKLFDALRAQGLRVAHVDRAWMVGIDPVRPPKPCQTGRTTAADEAASSRPQAPENVADEIARSIRTLSPTEYAITRRGVELFLENQASLTKTIRIVPEQRGGQTVGVRMFGVRADDVLGRVGFENGDRIDRVMGKPMSTPEQVLEVYAAIRTAKTIEIELERRGKPLKLVVRVE